MAEPGNGSSVRREVISTLYVQGARAMMWAGGAALPVAFMMLSHSLDAQDKSAAAQAQMASDFRLLQQTVKYMADTATNERAQIRSMVADHEGRIRVLEDVARVGGGPIRR